MTTPGGWSSDASNAAVQGYKKLQTYIQSRPKPEDRGALHVLDAKVGGKKVKVEIFADRIELRESSGVSGGKVTAGILTGGMSLAMTGVGKGTYRANVATGADYIALDAVTGISSRRDGGDSVVAVTTSSKVVELRLRHSDAQEAARTLNDLAAKARQAAPPPTLPAAHEVAAQAPNIVVNVSTGQSDAAALATAQLAALSSPDIMANLEKLADMRYKRLITDEEFDMMKAKLLGT